MAFDHVVIGGGPAGLFHAVAAAEAGRTVTVLECAEEPGGAVAALTLDGMLLNAGAESYAVGTGTLGAWVRRLGLEQQIAGPQGNASWVHTSHGAFRVPRDALWGIPTHPLAGDVRAALGWSGALRCWADALIPSSIGYREGVSVYDFVKARMGKRVSDRLLAPLIAGVHSADPQSLELEALIPGLARKVGELGSLRRAARAVLDERRARKSASTTAGAAVEATTPTMLVLINALVKYLESLGGQVLTGHKVSDVATTSQGWRIATEQGNSHTAETLTLATDPDTTRTLLAGAVPDVAQTIPEAPAAPVRLVTLSVISSGLCQHPRGNGVLVAPGTADVRAKAMTHLSAKWSHVQAQAQTQTNRSIVRLSYSQQDGRLPPLEDFPDTALRDLAEMSGVAAENIELRDFTVKDWPATQRRRLPGHAAALSAVGTALTRYPNLELAGSWRAGTGLDAIARYAASARIPSAASASLKPRESHGQDDAATNGEEEN